VPVRWSRVAAFYGLTFALTHGAAACYRLGGGSWSSMSAFVAANALMLVPGLVALAFSTLAPREPLRATLGLSLRPNRWWLVAWLLPPLLMLATLGASLALPGVSYQPDMSGLATRLGFPAAEIARLRGRIGSIPLPPLAVFVLEGLVLGPTLGAIGGLGEELAWRGFLYHETRSLGFGRCSLVTGVLWWLWHVPLTLQGYGYPQHPIAGTFVLLLTLLLFSPILTHVRARSRSVIAPAILHGTADGTVMLTLALASGGSDLTTGWGSLSCVAVLAVTSVVLIAVRARKTPPRTPIAPRPGLG
jgi:uncharacterized protein